MYVRFKILTVSSDLKNKCIIVESTHEIDSKSITPAHIRITHKGDTVEELLWDRYELKGRQILLYLKDDPLVNSEYLVRIKGLKNVVDEVLETYYNQTIVFKGLSDTCLQIISPAMHSIVEELRFKLSHSVQLYAFKHYEIELSQDAVFSNTVLRTVISEDNFLLSCETTGQLHLRVRGVFQEDLSEEDESHTPQVFFGDWRVTTFIYQPKTIIPTSFELTALEMPLDILTFPKQYQLPERLIYIFDCKVLSIDDTTCFKMINQNDGSEILTELQVQQNRLIVKLLEKPSLNQQYVITLENMQGDSGKKLLFYEHVWMSQFEPCYASPEEIVRMLDFEIDYDALMMQIKDASQLADYYANIKLNGPNKNQKYYTKLPGAMLFEKGQFVKNMVCMQTILQTRATLAIEAGFGGKLGEIEFSPKGSIPDLASTLKYFTNEADKWKLALQGYKDYIPDPTSALKSAKCRPHTLHDRGSFGR